MVRPLLMRCWCWCWCWWKTDRMERVRSKVWPRNQALRLVRVAHTKMEKRSNWPDKRSWPSDILANMRYECTIVEKRSMRQAHCEKATVEMGDGPHTEQIHGYGSLRCSVTPLGRVQLNVNRDILHHFMTQVCERRLTTC